jgi:hypothetical protein
VKPVIPYVRQSRTREGSVSIEDQLRDIRNWAERELTGPGSCRTWGHDERPVERTDQFITGGPTAACDSA